jgi:hypothetical protein
MGSKKHRGADAVLYTVAKGALKTTGALTADTWYEIVSKGVSPEVPDLDVGSRFLSPKYTGNAITLASGDSVYPLTLTEFCKVTVDYSGDMGVIDVTDDCDYPYISNLVDGYTNLSGSINTMVRFDEVTDDIIDAAAEFMNRFFDIVDDDGEGGYTLTEKDDSDLLLFILQNKNSLNVRGKVAVFLIVPIILNSISGAFDLKDSQKADYSWTKGQGPAQIYRRLTPTGS